MEKLYRVTGRTSAGVEFCADVTSRDSFIVDADPVLRTWALGKHEAALVSLCQHRHWKIEIVSGTVPRLVPR